MSEVRDMVIVGGGPVGLFAAFYAGFRGMTATLLEALPQVGGQLTVLYPNKYIYDVAGFPKILAKDLVANLLEQARRYDQEIRTEEPAQDLIRHEDGTFTVTTPKGSYRARSVLITAGIGQFTPNTLDRPGIREYEGRGVSYFVRDPVDFKGKRVLVVGGGDSAVDFALMLVGVAKSVTLIHRRDRFRAHESSVQELFASPVNVRLHHELKEVRGDGERVTEVVIFHNQTQEEDVLPVDAVILAIGYRANLGPLARWGLELEGRTIKVNCRMETNIPGVFAAGDVVYVEGIGNLKLLVLGFAQAALAVNVAKIHVDPEAKLFPGHSSNLAEAAGKK